jgi:hypothetical protein
MNRKNHTSVSNFITEFCDNTCNNKITRGKFVMIS